MKLTRRQFNYSMAGGFCGARLGAGATALRYAICNETFENMSFEQGCRVARSAGFTGLEIAPFTLSDDPARLPASRRRELASIMKSEGLQYVGLHAFLSAPKGLHVCSADEAVRTRSWDYFRSMVDLCADLDPGTIMVFGSGKQRQAVSPMTAEQAIAIIQEQLARIAPHALERRVTILMEPLAPHLCNVVTSLEQAMAVVRAVGSPAVRTIFDTHNAVKETVPHSELLRRYFPYIRHVHVNETDGRHPGAGDYDFRTLLQTLKQLSYAGWVSVEVFDFKPGGERIARESFRTLRQSEGPG